MPLARHGDGAAAVLRAYASQVHPVFMLPPVAATWFGAALAPERSLLPGVAVSVAAFCAVYTAHVTDGYVDFYRRGEDDDHPLTRRGCGLGVAAAAVGFGAAVAAVYATAGAVAAALVVPMWVIGILHAPALDTNPLTATVGYPAGIALCIVSGHYVQTGAVDPTPVAFAAVFLVTLSGVKVVDDATDHDYDRSIGKRTVAVALGRTRARDLAYALMAAGMFGLVVAAVSGVVPASAPLAAPAFAAVALVARRAGPELATMLLVRGAYLFLAVVTVAAWLRPLAGVPLPDIGVLGPYTYLATEVAFGAAALGLLRYTGAIRRAARTVAALYPVAYVWDWYTLEVGVFAIPLRTGVELAGIPVEEHLFMVVVPSLVVGVHELLHGPATGGRSITSDAGAAAPDGDGEADAEPSAPPAATGESNRAPGATPDAADPRDG
jgi:lycopene cyclase domain-containing protein